MDTIIQGQRFDFSVGRHNIFMAKRVLYDGCLGYESEIYQFTLDQETLRFTAVTHIHIISKVGQPNQKTISTECSDLILRDGNKALKIWRQTNDIDQVIKAITPVSDSPISLHSIETTPDSETDCSLSLIGFADSSDSSHDNL